MSEEFWSCGKCDKSGPYYGNDYHYPKGWKFDLTHGLVCARCAKKFDIKTSDVEKEVVKKIEVVKPLWESL